MRRRSARATISSRRPAIDPDKVVGLDSIVPGRRHAQVHGGAADQGATGRADADSAAPVAQRAETCRRARIRRRRRPATPVRLARSGAPILAVTDIVKRFGDRRRRARSRSTASRSTSRRASSCRSSGRRAAASRRCSTSSAAWSATTKAASTVDGETVSGTHPAFGMVFQEESTFPWRTVIDNVAFPLELAGVREARAARARARISSSMVGPRRASSAAIRPSSPAACGSASRSRARSRREPRILLMDEPFAALDEQTRLLLGDKVLQIQQQLRADDAADHAQHHRSRAALRSRAGDDLSPRPVEAHVRHRPAATARLRGRSAATRSATTSRRSGTTCARKRAAACATTNRASWHERRR